MRREVVAWCRMLRWCFLATLMLGAFFSGAAPSSSLRSLRRWLSPSAARLAPLSSSTTAVGDPSFASAGASVTVPSGLVAIFKPKNWTSSDVVMKVKGVLLRGMQQRCASKFKLKIGHGGTLDPLAEGVLVLGVGEGTKLMAQYLEGSKGYQAVACLGAETDTLDCTGEVIERVDCSAIDERALDAALAQFRGDICQVPPMYSALKRDGKKLYELARAGIEVEREARNVSVYSLQLTAEVQEDAAGHVKRKLQLPLFGLDVSSSGGFYVRSLISDVARACGGRAHMTALLRVKQGPFGLVDCLAQDEWEFDRLCAGIVATSAKAGLDAGAMKPACVGTRVAAPPENLL